MGGATGQASHCQRVGHLGMPTARHKYQVYHKSIPDLTVVSLLVAGAAPLKLGAEIGCGNLQSSMPCRLRGRWNGDQL